MSIRDDYFKEKVTTGEFARLSELDYIYVDENGADRICPKYTAIQVKAALKAIRYRPTMKI